MSKHTSLDFKWRHYEGELILLCVRWYLRYRSIVIGHKVRKLRFAATLKKCLNFI